MEIGPKRDCSIPVGPRDKPDTEIGLRLVSGVVELHDQGCRFGQRHFQFLSRLGLNRRPNHKAIGRNHHDPLQSATHPPQEKRPALSVMVEPP